MLRLLYFVAFLVPFTINANAVSCIEHQCIAVVDAGSTGSRLHIFAYDRDETNTPFNIEELWSKKIKPGLATIEANQNTIDAYLTILFSGTPVQNVPVYFYATGGMRLISQTKQKLYYREIQNWFNQQPAWKLIEAKTIQGNDEALYDWLAVNYHLDTLKSTSSEPIGVMDIGGASVQVVFPIVQSAGADKSSFVELNLYGKHINLFVHSFLGLGQNEMTHQLLDTTACFSEGYPLPDGNLGKGDANTCQQEVSSLINRVHKVQNEIQPVLMANPISLWYAIGGLANLAESAPFRFHDNQITNQDLLNQANNLICHQQWEQLSNQFPNNEFIESFCLLPAFYYALMVEGYGISASQPVNYIASEKNLDWTLGVVLQQ